MAEPSPHDRLSLTALATRSANAFDLGDAAAFAACFTNEAVLTTSSGASVQGRAAIEDFAQRAQHPGRQFRHLLSNFRFEVSGATAELRCYLLCYVTESGATEIVSPGRYLLRAVSHDGAWRISQRQTLLDRAIAIEL